MSIRSFIAIDLPVDIHDNLQQVLNSLKTELAERPIRWVEAQRIHLTLKFLGDVSETNIKTITDILQVEAANHKAFELSVGSLGVFPNMNRPRIIWVGVEAPDELLNLQRRLEAETARLGYPAEEREFMPHLTLGRVSRNASAAEVRAIGETLKQQKLGFVGAARIDEVHLFRSDLEPDGAVYSKQFSARLAQD